MIMKWPSIGLPKDYSQYASRRECWCCSRGGAVMNNRSIQLKCLHCTPCLPSQVIYFSSIYGDLGPDFSEGHMPDGEAPSLIVWAQGNLHTGMHWGGCTSQLGACKCAHPFCTCTSGILAHDFKVIVHYSTLSDTPHPY